MSERKKPSHEQRVALLETFRRGRSLLADVEQALNDWIATYAAECCDKEAEAEAMRRIETHGGTLCYVTDLRERVTSARKETPDSNPPPGNNQNV